MRSKLRTKQGAHRFERQKYKARCVQIRTPKDTDSKADKRRLKVDGQLASSNGSNDSAGTPLTMEKSASTGGLEALEK